MVTATTLDARSAYRSAIKRDAVEIRAAKAELRTLQREDSPLVPTRQSLLAGRRVAARARLIAYGLHRGMPLERMEAGRTSIDQLPFNVQMMLRQTHAMAPSPDS